jgi:alanine racemase
MDLIMADVSRLPADNCRPGAEVVLMGRQGQEEISAADLAEKAETIAYEIFTGISARVPRVVSAR